VGSVDVAVAYVKEHLSKFITQKPQIIEGPIKAHDWARGSCFPIRRFDLLRRGDSPPYLGADASLRRLSRICAGVQAAKPKTNAGLSLAWMQKNDSIIGLIPISARTRATLAKSAS